MPILNEVIDGKSGIEGVLLNGAKIPLGKPTLHVIFYKDNTAGLIREGEFEEGARIDRDTYYQIKSDSKDGGRAVAYNTYERR